MRESTVQWFKVSIHAPVKERPVKMKREARQLGVSIHAPVKERRDCWRGVFHHADVSIHAPVKERHRRRQKPAARARFDPRSCEGATASPTRDTPRDAFRSTLL